MTSENITLFSISLVTYKLQISAKPSKSQKTTRSTKNANNNFAKIRSTVVSHYIPGQSLSSGLSYYLAHAIVQKKLQRSIIKTNRFQLTNSVVDL